MKEKSDVDGKFRTNTAESTSPKFAIAETQTDHGSQEDLNTSSKGRNIEADLLKIEQ